MQGTAIPDWSTSEPHLCNTSTKGRSAHEQARCDTYGLKDKLVRSYDGTCVRVYKLYSIPCSLPVPALFPKYLSIIPARRTDPGVSVAMDHELLPIHVVCASLVFFYLFVLTILFFDDFFGSGAVS